MQKKIYNSASGTLFYREWNEREKGSGQKLVLLHASPLSSVMFERLAPMLSADIQIVAPDLSGYGGSIPLPFSPQSIDDYLPILHDFFHHIGFEKFMLYGTATGCQVAIAYALRYPEDVLHLFGENACHFEEEERNTILERYFPDPTPTLDGSHLKKLWEMCLKTNVAFPWFEVADDDPRLANVPLPIVQIMFNETLKAGAGYDLAYRAAFAHERAEKVQSLLVPATFLIWSGSILKPAMERLASFPMPKNVRFERCDGDLAQRYERLVSMVSNNNDL
jgi:pimeloyl-ACP methyl ester carboxylesterase